MSTFNYSPSYAASVQKTPRTRTAVFMDGYQARVADGINTQPRMWNLTFTRIPSEIDTIETFFSDRLGSYCFSWTPPSGAAGIWKCKQWNRTEPNFTTSTLTATFEEVFGCDPTII
jgi:phage-related protein